MISLLAPESGLPQLRIGTVSGVVSDPSSAPILAAEARLENPTTGFARVSRTDGTGTFAFRNVPFDRYTLRIHSPGFHPSVRNFRVRSGLPVIMDVKLEIAGAHTTVQVETAKAALEEDSSRTETEFDNGFVQRQPSMNRSRKLLDLVATTPGMMTENNGLIHVRGVDDGILYVIDGIPITDRIDMVSSGALDTDAIRSVNILTGNFPAEFGGRSGAVVSVLPRSGIDEPLHGSLTGGFGNFRERAVGATVGGTAGQNFGFFIASFGNRSRRYLDPVEIGNFHNHGRAGSLHTRFDWHLTPKDTLWINLSVAGSDFNVPNDRIQETAGQRQVQKLQDNSQSVSWQHVWSANSVSHVAYFRRLAESRLFPSPRDTPISASQRRQQSRQGVLGSLAHRIQGHTFKTGTEVTRVRPKESFSFFITDEEIAQDREISEQAMEFTPDNPFVFQDVDAGTNVSWYAQDSFSPIENLTLDLGLRFDRSSLPAPEQQFSPRIGGAWYLPSTRTVIRASFNRLYMPPQLENLLLANSRQARDLSPFAKAGGGAPVRAERVSASEIGFSQDLGGAVRFDAAYWWRSFVNFGDPNVFFNTTIVFPNSVAKGIARGLEVRLEVPYRKGLSGYLSYTNGRILQTGPINGGLFLTDEFIEIGAGTQFIPDHDQRNAGAFGVHYYHRRSGVWGTFSGRHESGVPLEVDEESIENLISRPDSDLVDFQRRRVKPWSVLDFSLGIDLLRDRNVQVSAQVDVRNIANNRFAYNFGNPFEGTHFGHPRLLGVRLRLSF